MYPLAKAVLFKLDAERAHDLVVGGLAAAGQSLLARRALSNAYALTDERLAVESFGLRFPNPLGLAAGLDKDGVAAAALAAVGFGAVELGSVTALPQLGNPRPRLFRLPEDEALINRMGFNNHGAAALAARLARLRAGGYRGAPIGVNVGKSRAVDLSEAENDYRSALTVLWPVADYLVLNVSSPNTPGLRTLQEQGPLERLLRLAAALKRELGKKAVLLKLAPDLSETQLAEIAGLCAAHGLDGLIATNTTVERGALISPLASETGGLSGRPLAARSLAVLRTLRQLTDLPIVSVGGLFSAADVIERLRAGADLVQVYTAFIYRGPALVRQVLRGLLDTIEAKGVANLRELAANLRGN